MSFRIFAFITLYLLSNSICSQANKNYTCSECFYIPYYDSVFSKKPYQLLKKGPFYKDTETTKQTIYDLTSIANHNSDNDVVNYLFKEASIYFEDSIFKGIFCTQKSLHSWNLGYLDSALYYDYQAIDLLRPSKSILIHEAYFSLAQTYRALDSVPLALNYGTKAINILEKNLKSHSDSITVTSISYFLYSIYNKNIEAESLANKYFEKAKLFSIATKDYQNQFLVNSIIIEKLTKKDLLDSALSICIKNIKMLKSNDFNFYLGYARMYAGEILFKQNKMQEANLYFDSVITYNISNPTTTLASYKYKVLSSEKKNITTNLTKLLNYKDSINNLENNENIALLTTKFETKRIQKENEVLQKENLLKEQQITIRNISIIAIIIIMLASLYWIMERRKRKQLETENKLLVIGQKLLRTQMNPHFIFNSLSAIQNVISNGDNLKAEEELGSFATLIRQILDSSRAELIEIDSEIALISTFLKIHQTILGDSFDYKVNIKNNLDNHDILIPPMLIQPFVENAIQYGELIDNKNFIELNLSIKEDRFIYEIINNGKWVDKSKKQQSHSINITKERILVLNKNRKDYIHFFIEKKPKVKITFSFKIN